MNNPVGYLLLTALSIALGYVVYSKGPVLGIVLLAAIIGAPLLVATMFNLRLGIIMIITLSFFVLGVKRLTEGVPLGLVMDIMIALMGFGMFVKHIDNKDWKWAKSPISNVILIWIAYNLLEVGNPAATSRMAWVMTVRSFAGFMAMYFIILYSLNGMRYVSFIIKLWILLTTLGALYGIWQEFMGFTTKEMAWIQADEGRVALLYVMGRYRKFSFFSDPMIMGFVMAYTATLCFTLLSAPIFFWKKVLLVVVGSLMVTCMVYSGTRAAYVLLPVGGFFYAMITFKRNILIACGIGFMIGLVIVNMPTSNPNLVRFQTAFHPDDDPSYRTRKRNQAFIKPYIQTHPMGGGLGSVGGWGEKYSPGSMLAKFPPDSGYVRIAVEMGPIGLFIYCYLMWTICRVGIKNHFRIKDPFIKAISLSLLTVFYTLVVANFPQEALGQIPTSLILFLIIALLSKLRDFDKIRQREIAEYARQQEQPENVPAMLTA